MTSPDTNGSPKRRHRRTDEEMLADLEAQVEAVRRRAATRGAKKTDSGQAFMAAVKAVDKALAVCDGDMQRALERARAALSEQMIAMGMRTPETKRGRPRGS